MEWTEERVAQLRSLWDQGLSASRIAQEMGGISRNAVIGKAHRLALPKRPSPIKRNPDAAASRRRRPAAPPKPAGATVLDLTERMCRWPNGHPGSPDFHFCAAKTVPGFPYCEEHVARAYQPAVRRTNAATGAK